MWVVYLWYTPHLKVLYLHHKPIKFYTMKIKFGSILTDGRGKLGGQVYARNRSGAYVRNKVTPNNPQSGFQSTARARLAGFSEGWRGLTQAQRDAWNAAGPDFPKTNQFG